MAVIWRGTNTFQPQTSLYRDSLTVDESALLGQNEEFKKFRDLWREMSEKAEKEAIASKQKNIIRNVICPFCGKIFSIRLQTERNNPFYPSGCPACSHIMSNENKSKKLEVCEEEKELFEKDLEESLAFN